MPALLCDGPTVLLWRVFRWHTIRWTIKREVMRRRNRTRIHTRESGLACRCGDQYNTDGASDDAGSQANAPVQKQAVVRVRARVCAWCPMHMHKHTTRIPLKIGELHLPLHSPFRGHLRVVHRHHRVAWNGRVDSDGSTRFVCSEVGSGWCYCLSLADVFGVFCLIHLHHSRCGRVASTLPSTRSGMLRAADALFKVCPTCAMCIAECCACC